MAAASRGAALGGSNPSGDGGPRLLSSPGKGNKPVALADITNTARPSDSRPISVADVVKEDAKFIHLLHDTIKITGTNLGEMQKLHSQMLAVRLHLHSQKPPPVPPPSMAAASRGAALSGSNPSGDGGPRLLSSPGKGNKPVALADITNTGRPSDSRSISVADVVKDNAELIQLQEYRREILQLTLTNSKLRRTNSEITRANAQMLADFNRGKDRIKTLQHELSCTRALLNVKNSEVEAANQRRKEDVLKARPSEVSAVDTNRSDGSVMSAVVESQSARPSNPGCQDPPQDAAKQRGSNEHKLALCEEDSNVEGDATTSDALCYKNKRKSQRRKCARLNSVPYYQRRKSARLNSVPSEHNNGTFENLQGRKRSLRLAAKEVVTYKEIHICSSLRS